MGDFEGFPSPTKNFFSLPNEMINIIAHIDNMAELKIIIYVIRHTWGYQEYGITKAITVEEFMYGRKRQDGTRMDAGTGLQSDRSVKDGIKAATKHGYLICDVDDTDKARIKKSYALKMLSEGYNLPPDDRQVVSTPLIEENRQVVSTPLQGSIYPSDRQHLPPYEVDATPRSEKDTLERHLEKDTLERQGTFVASATPALSQENVFDVTDEDCAPDNDAEAETVKASTPKNVTAVTSSSTSDYTNEGGEHARHDYCSEQRPGVSVFPPALAGSDVPPDLHDTPDADQGHPGLSAGLHAASSRDRTDAQTPGDQAVTPSQHTTPDVLAGAASGKEQALDAAAMAPPSSAPPASGGKPFVRREPAKPPLQSSFKLNEKAMALTTREMRDRYEAHFWQLLEGVRAQRGLIPPVYGRSWKAKKYNQDGVNDFYADGVSDETIVQAYTAVLDSKKDTWLRENFTVSRFYERLQGLLDSQHATQGHASEVSGRPRRRNFSQEYAQEQGGIH